MDTYVYYPDKVPPMPICKMAEDGRHVFDPPHNQCLKCNTGSLMVGDTVLYVPTEKGVEYHARSEPNVLMFGGRGSAKSTTGRYDAHLRALANPGLNYIIMRRTFPQLQSSHLNFIQREIKLLGGYFNQTSKRAYYPNGSIGTFAQCDGEEDVLKLLSAEFGLMVFDELSTFEWEWFTKLGASARVPVGAGYKALVRGLTNPFGPSAEKIKEYFDTKDVDLSIDPDYNPADWYAIKANLPDNPYLDQKEYLRRFAGITGDIRKAWVDGDWALESSLFNFKPTIKRANGEVTPYHVINDIDLPKLLKHATIYRAIDAGWYPDPTVVLWIAHLGNRHIVFHEKLWWETVADDIVTDIRSEEQRLGITKVAMTFCDPSMDFNTSADVKTLKEKYEALGIPMENSVNKRDMFATVIHHALNEQAGEYLPRIQFFKNGVQGCPYLVKTIPQMRHDDKRFGFMADHKDDHAVVALAYYLLSHLSDSRESREYSSTLRPWMKAKPLNRFILGNDQVRTPTL